MDIIVFGGIAVVICAWLFWHYHLKVKSPELISKWWWQALDSVSVPKSLDKRIRKLPFFKDKTEVETPAEEKKDDQ